MREKLLERALAQAVAAFRVKGHDVSCNFTGCSCGSVEQFKIELAEFYRLLQKLK